MAKKTKRVGGPRKGTKSSLDKKLLKAWATIVVKRQDGKCEICGKRDVQAHHIVGRRNYLLRYDLRNGMALCSGCHVFRKDSVHQSPTTLYQYMVDYRPEDWDYLQTVENEIKKWSVPELEELLGKYDKLISKEKWNSVITFEN